MKDGIESVVNGLPEEKLGVLASLRDTQIEAAAAPKAASAASMC